MAWVALVLGLLAVPAAALPVLGVADTNVDHGFTSFEVDTYDD